MLAEALTPDGTLFELYRHDREYIIRADGTELMSTRRHHSEEQLAELACEPLRELPGANVLIGGLGFGFTLRAALRLLPFDARVIVAEIVAAVIDWNTTPAYRLAADGFDAIILDVDNGADALTTEGNARLYRSEGIRMAVAALRPAGRLAYWSADADPAFERSLRGAGLTVNATAARAHATTGRWHTLYVAHVARGAIAGSPA